MAKTLFFEALQSKQTNSSALLPFDISLPDFFESGKEFIEYLHDRLQSHCPFVSASYIKDILRDSGALLICDSFERISTENRAGITSKIRMLVQDYPKIKMILFSRGNAQPKLPFIVLKLEKLSKEEVNTVAKLASEEFEMQFFPALIPQVILDLCQHPLLLGLVINHFKRHQTHPDRFSALFDTWLNNILGHDDSAIIKIEREKALSLIALSTIDEPLTTDSAIDLLRENDILPSIFDDLVTYDAIHIKGRTVEVQHEALADYLRALRVVNQETQERKYLLSKISLSADSLLAVLLISLLSSRIEQRILWERLAQLDIKTYLNALRFHADISLDNAKLADQERIHNYLEDILDGFIQPLHAFCGELKAQITEAIASDANGQLSIAGTKSPDSQMFAYQFGLRNDDFPEKVNLKLFAKHSGTTYAHSPALWGKRSDSGRQIGIGHLSASINEVIMKRKLLGGETFVNERAIGRLRYLSHIGEDIDLNQPLNDIEAFLIPYADEMVLKGIGWRGKEYFHINDLIEDIRFLQSQNIHKLDQWWVPYGGLKNHNELTNEEIKKLLNEYYRRYQLAYVEVVERSFSKLNFRLTPVLPLRWNISITRSSDGRLVYSFYWLPIEKWEDAGADVHFSESANNLDIEKYVKTYRAQSLTLNRPDNHGAMGSSGLFPQFDGNNWNSSFDGETAVMRKLSEIFIKENKEFFEGFPHVF